ncbi:MAG: hypothetical protein ACK4YP_24720, partial [Myxococcota bacterium]
TFTLDRWRPGHTATGTVTCTTTVSVPEAREVLGRRVTAVRVTPACVGASLDAAWLVEGIGLVETDEKRLVAYEP